MADSKITQLPEASTLSNDDLLVVVQDTDTTPTTTAATLADVLSAAVAAVDSVALYVRKDGDTMNGGLDFISPLSDNTTSFVPTTSGDYSIASDSPDANIYIGVNTADQTLDGSGSVVVGRFRSSVPIESATDGTTLTSNPYASAVIPVSGGAVRQLTIRKNNGTAGSDFFVGNQFSAYATQAEAQVEFLAGSANVHLLVPDGLEPKSRGRYSVITATLVQADVTDTGGGTFTHDDEYWLISGDLQATP